MQDHELKTWPIFFSPLRNGVKTFDIRKNDRDFQVGDRVIFNEYDQTNDRFTGRIVTRHITYIMQGGQMGLPEGYVIMALR
jgi:hypothetical protein